MVTYVISAIFVLGILIIVHEMGHFLMARRMGVGVEKFSIGFGPTIWSKKIGETEYIVAWVPLGGYVKMVGDEEGEESSNPELAFNLKPVWRRIMVVAAGPLANLMFAALVFSIIYMIGMAVPDTKIKEVLKGSPAESVGIKPGDRIIEIDGKEINNWNDIVESISDSPGVKVRLAVEREGGEILDFTITPETQTGKTLFGEEIQVGRIGVAPDNVFKRYGPVKSLYLGVKKTGEIIYITGLVIVKIFQNVVPANTIGGPLMIFKIAGDSAEAGLLPLLMFIGVLSVNLGILNLLPVPILDGGHLVFFAIEGLIGKPVSLKGREIAQQVGLFMLIMLMVFAFYNDITRFLASE